MENTTFKLHNRQRSTAVVFLSGALLMLVVTVLPFVDENPLSGLWAVAFVGIFLTLSFAAAAFIFFKRTQKADKLIDGSELLFRWKMTDEMLREFVNFQYEKNRAKNKAVIIVIGILFALISIPFLFILEGEELVLFFLIFGGIFGLLFVSAFFFPLYYKRRNSAGDGLVLLGAQYAYINGYFHNWDFPFSGINKVKPITEPFRGIQLVYRFADRTGPRTHELNIPVPKAFDLKEIGAKLKGNKSDE